MSADRFRRPTRPESRAWARRFAGMIVFMLILFAALYALFDRYAPNRPVDLADDREHFLYGSIGSDVENGLPVRILTILPQMFPEYLPAGAPHDYTAFGFIREPDRDLPIGFSTRRRIIDLTGLNCAVCHTGSVRVSVDAEPMIIPAMPANTVDLLAFFEFLFNCAGDWRFTTEKVLEAMDAQAPLSRFDRELYSLVIPQMQSRLLARKEKLAFLLDPEHPDFGPGRVDTFNTFKVDQFAEEYYGYEFPSGELIGTVDFPSVWNQAARDGLQLHWDGNNSSVRERNFSAALGAGATRENVDIPRLFRVEEWLAHLDAPAYPFEINETLLDRGEALFMQYCHRCHDFAGADVGTVVPLDEIQTDEHRLNSYTRKFLHVQQAYTRGYEWEFTHFTKTDGYANLPLDGIWARAPYLHNGSVPTMWDMLRPAEQRPPSFYRGNDVYSAAKMGFESEASSANGRKFFLFDTSKSGNSNRGHSEPEYGTELSDSERWALIEFLKTL